MASSPDPEPAEGDEVRWPLVAKIGVGLAASTVVAFVVAALLAVFVVEWGDEPELLVASATDPVAPVALADGDVLYAERTTGRIVRVDPTGKTVVVAELSETPATDGQRGLLGLAVRETGDRLDVYGSWTRAADSRLVVGRIPVDGDGPGDGEVLVWEGPPTAESANGGTLVFRGDELLIGVGELRDPGSVDDPATPNGKILALDPDGPPGQAPAVVSGGWHNPFALAVVGRDVWLADNAPGRSPERLARIAPDGTVVSIDLEGKRAPSGLAVRDDDELVLCGFVSEVAERVAVRRRGVDAPSGEATAAPCATGVAVLADGAIVTTTTDAVWIG